MDSRTAKQAIASIAAQQAPMMTKATVSSGDSVVSVESISSDVARLAGDVNFWKTVRIVASVFAIILTVVTVLAQWMEFKRSGELSKKQGELRKLENNRRDSRIGEATTAATTANENATKASVQSRIAEKETAEVKQRIADRHLTPKQRSLLVSLLMNGPRGKVAITCPHNDSEALCANLAARYRRGDSGRQMGHILGRNIHRQSPVGNQNLGA